MPPIQQCRWSSSECLSYGEKEMKLPGRLNRRNRGAVQQIQVGSLESVKRWRVQAVRQIQAHRTHRGLIANAESRRLHHIVEIREIALVIAEGNAAQVRVDVAEI